MNRINWSRVPVATLVAFGVSLLTFSLLFGSPVVQNVFYSTAAGQSEKFVEVWKTTTPLPALSPAGADTFAISGRKLAEMGLLLVWMLAVVVVYALVAESLPGTGWRKGLSYGGVVWAVAFLFFGFFFHFNVLNMPLSFVLLALVLEAGITVAVGVTIAALYRPAL